MTEIDRILFVLFARKTAYLCIVHDAPVLHFFEGRIERLAVSQVLQSRFKLTFMLRPRNAPSHESSFFHVNVVDCQALVENLLTPRCQQPWRGIWVSSTF
jgi:hypothetical protein